MTSYDTKNFCLDCNVDISHRFHTARYCLKCSSHRGAIQSLDRYYKKVRVEPKKDSDSSSDKDVYSSGYF